MGETLKTLKTHINRTVRDLAPAFGFLFHAGLSAPGKV
jgi:hypothetical protein